MTLLSQRLGAVAPSATVGLAQKMREMRAAGVDVIDLVEGESDFPTPAHVIEAAFCAARDGETRYTAVAGTPALKMAIRARFAENQGLQFDDVEVMATCGAKQAIYNAFLATLNPGDEVIIPAPYWVSYPDMVRLCGGTAVSLPCEAASGFLIDCDQLQRAITPKTRWLVLNSPGNPSGAIYTRSDLETILEIVRHHPGLMVLSDDIYEHLRFDSREFVTSLQVAPDLRSRILIVNGTSKSYAMTGWRIGYAAGPRDLIAAMTVLQEQTTTNPASVSQAAAAAALQGPQDFIAKHTRVMEHRRNVILESLSGIEGITCPKPEGAFYVYPSVKGLIGRRDRAGQILNSDLAVADYLITRSGVGTVPGTAFGDQGHLRLCFARQEAQLREAGRRIAGAVKGLGH